MKTHYVTVAVAVMLAVGAGYWAGQRKGMHEGAQTVGAGNTANSTAAASGTAGTIRSPVAPLRAAAESGMIEMKRLRQFLQFRTECEQGRRQAQGW